jgi:hypothetical protein
MEGGPEHAAETLSEDVLPPPDSESSQLPNQTAGSSGSVRTEKSQEVPPQHSWQEELRTIRRGQFPRILSTAKSTAMTPKSSTISRDLFTDGLNSMWHFVFGLFAIRFPLLVPMFIVYQALDIYEINVFVDIYEFLAGYVAGYAFSTI